MNPTLHLLRAISGLYLQRIAKIVIGVATGILGLAWVGVIYFGSTYTTWWYIFLLVLIPATVIIVVIWIVSRFLIAKLMPRKLSKHQRKQLIVFTDKVVSNIETVRTPVPLLGWRVLEDILRRRDSKLLCDTIDNTYSLKTDFEELKKLFL